MEEEHCRPPRSEVAPEERVRQLEAELAGVREELRAAHEKQRQGDETFRRFSDSGVLGIAVFSLSGQFAFANEAFLAMTGYQQEDIAAGRVQWQQLTPPEWTARAALALEALHTGGDCAPFECEYLRPDGTRFWGLFTGVRMTGETAVAFLLDITERKRAEQALFAERERLRVTLASIGDGVIVTDSAGQPTFLNPMAEALTGWTLAEARGRSLDEVFRIINEQTRSPAENPVRRVLREGVVVGLANHTVLITREGAERAIDDSAAPIPDGFGKTAGVVLVFRDVTERRRAEEARARLAAIVESSDVAIFSKDMAGNVTSWNRAAEQLYGYSAAEMIGAPVTRIIPPERADELPAIMQRLRRGEPIEQYETVRVRKDGERLDMLVNIAPLRSSDGQISGASVVARDITEARRAQEALREADRRKDDFLAMLAHELRNPLAPLRNAVQILRFRSGDPPTVERVREMMDRQVHHMARLVDDLLDVSRITRGKIALRRERLDLARLVHASGEDHQAAFEAAGLTLKLELPDRPVWVVGDTTRLTQVLDNLLENARKFTDRGGEVTVHLAADTTSADAVLSVRDTGIGIDPEAIPGLFEVFAQADRSLDRSRGGLGLGLPLLKGLVELHGGRVEARSEGIGHGAQFILRLPRAEELPALSQSAAALSRGQKRLRVLVVEDNPDAAESLQMLLELFGYEVSVVHSGAAGVEAARRERPDVVVCDIGLPGMDGFAVASALRQDPVTTATRLIALTGYGQEEDRQRAREAGFDEHLTKPVNPDVLLARLDPAAS